MPFIRKEGGRGNQVRIYGQPSADFEYIISDKRKSKKILLDSNGLPIVKLDGREDVFDGWLKRDSQEEEKRNGVRAEREYWSNPNTVTTAFQEISSKDKFHRLLNLRFNASSKSLEIIEKALELLPSESELQIKLSTWLWQWDKLESAVA